MKRIDFENGSVTGNILGATLPMLVAQILNLLYNIVDRVYIARIPKVGTTALGAVGLCFPIIVIITAFSNLFGTGGAPLFSIYRGKKQENTAVQIMDTSFSMLCICGVFLMLIGFLFARSDPGCIRCFFECPYLCLSLYNDLPDRNDSFHDFHRDESFYQRPGIFNHRHAFCCHRSCCKPSARSFVYLCPWFWSTGSCDCHHTLSDFIRSFCTVFPYQKIRIKSPLSQEK